MPMYVFKVTMVCVSWVLYFSLLLQSALHKNQTDGWHFLTARNMCLYAGQGMWRLTGKIRLPSDSVTLAQYVAFYPGRRFGLLRRRALSSLLLNISILFSLGLSRSKILVLRFGPKMNTNVAFIHPP